MSPSSKRCRAVVPWVVASALAAVAPLAGAQERQESPPALPLDRAISARVQRLEAEQRQAREAGSKDTVAWAADRPQRAARHRAQVAELWGSVSGTLDGQARLRSHADRMARLDRMLDLAQRQPGAPLVSRIKADITREIAHFDAAMQALRSGGAQ